MNQVPAGAGRFGAWVPAAAGIASGSLFASSLWAPPLGFLLSLASPLPLAVETYRRGRTGAAAAVAAGVAATWLLGGLLGAAVYLSQFAAGGCLLGWAARNRQSPAIAIGGYAVVAACAFAASSAWLAARSGTALNVFLDQALAQSMDQAVTQVLQGNNDAEFVLAVQAWAEQTRNLLVTIFPGLFAALALVTGWGNALALRRIARATEQDPWLRWRAPEGWIWALIGSGLGWALLPAPLGTLALNVFIITAAVYLLLGIAVIQFLFEHKGFPRLFRVAAYCLLLMQLPVMLLVAALGMFDLWFDFRARIAAAPGRDARGPS